MSRISGPLLDRIDIQCSITPVPFSDLEKAAPQESSSAIRERVIRARQVQSQRFRQYDGIYCNAQMTPKLLHQFCRLDEHSLALLRNAMERLGLSARAYDRILKVSRTIADLDNSEMITSRHIAEAISYRSLDRADWL